MAIFTALWMCSCQDWGESDPPAGNQIYPTLEQVTNLTFDDELLPEEIQTFAYEGGDVPFLETDNALGQVLHLKNGYARIFNPLNNVKVQNGVSLTMWVKQAIPAEGEEQDLTGALFSFQNANGSQRMFFTANGWLSYEGVDGSYEDNNPENAKTGLMTPGEWHYLAIALTKDGYFVYVDGLKKIEKPVHSFDFSKIVNFMASVSNIYFGYGSDTQTNEMWLDNVKIYRNTITSKEWKAPNIGGGEEEDYGNYLIVGNEDFTTGWWSAFSPLVKMKGNNKMHWGFYNYTSGNQPYHNWVLVITNGKDRNESGYAEYAVLRADAYAWGLFGNSNDNANLLDEFSNNYNFDTFTSDMSGAYVDLTIERNGKKLSVKAVTTTESGATYNYSFGYTTELTDEIGAFLTCEGAYLKIDVEQTVVGEVYEANSYVVGPEDCSAGWWQSFSKHTPISGNTEYPFVYVLYNKTSMISNWHNWIMVITNGKDRDEAGYAEYAVVRADGYAWGAFGNSNENADKVSISHTYDWTTFPTQMNGAYCRLAVERTGSTVTITAKIRTAAGESLGDLTFSYPNGITTSEIGSFLTVEQASLDIRAAGFMPFWDEIKQ